MGLAGPRRLLNWVEADLDGQKFRGVYELASNTVILTTRTGQKTAFLDGREPNIVARDLLLEHCAKQRAPAEVRTSPTV
jgi:hypothetical protein